MKHKIFVWAVPAPDWGPTEVIGFAMLDTGLCIASHLSSNVEWAKHDMGIRSNWKHDTYQQHCLEGYELVWVNEPDSHDEWKAAYDLNQSKKTIVSQS